jgi:hypothetical protein
MVHKRLYAAATVAALGLLAGPATGVAAAQTGPDLVAGDINYTPNGVIHPGDRIHFETCVENKGDQATGPFNIAWYVDDQRLGYGSHSGVPAHSKQCNGNSFFDWTVPDSNYGFNGARVRWAVDEDNMIPDIDRSNNRSFTILGWTNPNANKPGAR